VPALDPQRRTKRHLHTEAYVSGLALQLPDAVVEAIAERAAELVLERLTPEPASPYLTVAEAAEHARCSRQRIYDLCSSGRLHRYKDGARVLVSRAEIEAHLATYRPRDGRPE
jgi:excisionase family DNA binding protein